MTDTDIRDTSEHDTSPWWKSTWPLDHTDWIRLAIALGIVIAIYVAVGEILTNVALFDGIIEYDRRLADEIVAGRTDTKNSIARWSSFISDTPVKIVASLAVAALLLWRLRRWREAVLVGLPLMFEAAAYFISSHIVLRPRPDVERLIDSPVDASWPSGHVAAAAVYAALAFIVLWHTRSTVLRVLAVVGAVVATGMVAWARMYQGMHYLSDVIAGAVLGITWVIICRRIVRAPADAEDVLVDDQVDPAADAT